jgi:hypothetical protein
VRTQITIITYTIAIFFFPIVATFLVLHDLNSSISFLHPNAVQIIGAIMGAAATLLAAFIAIKTAFGQISKQFEHKILYEGWQDLQQKLFDFSKALVNYDSKVSWLNYFLDSQDNPLINGGDKSKYRLEKWKELEDTYHYLQESYVAFLRSFENHEIIFLPLREMKHIFQEEYREKIGDHDVDFVEKIFPEIYGLSDNLSLAEMKGLIEAYYLKMSEISAYMEDFRAELQNVTVGKVLNKRIPMRKPYPGYKILTKNGIIIQK